MKNPRADSQRSARNAGLTRLRASPQAAAPTMPSAEYSHNEVVWNQPDCVHLLQGASQKAEDRVGERPGYTGSQSTGTGQVRRQILKDSDRTVPPFALGNRVR